MSRKIAVITGITGQDGSYMAELLLAKGYEVHGVVRRASFFNRKRLDHLRTDPKVHDRRLFLHYADLRDASLLRRIVTKTKPDELYHFAGQSHVGLSFEMAESTCEEISNATLSLFEICRDLADRPRIYSAVSSEIFGSPEENPQTEETAYWPTNPYGCAKAFVANLGQVYRKGHGLFVCNGIAYNHESPRRSENFVTRKISASAARIACGTDEVLELGNLDAERDWGYAPEYVEAMWAMLQQSEPNDYVLATGSRTSVRDFARCAFRAVGLELEFSGNGIDEHAVDAASGRIVLRVNPSYFRPIDAAGLIGDASKAESALGFKPKTIGGAVAELMAKADFEALSES